MDRSNVDTDQIIPKQFLKRIERTGFGQFLFNDWRFLSDGTPDPSFELNRPEAEGATILLARRNFGCGLLLQIIYRVLRALPLFEGTTSQEMFTPWLCRVVVV